MFVKKSHPGSGMASHEILPLMPQAFYIAKQSFTREAYFIQPRQRMDFIEKSTLARAFFLASLKGFEPPAYRLGVAPISHREVTPDAKKCLEILGFSAFPIPSDTTL